MKINLIDIDSTIPNLALHKVALYHQGKGDEVYWNFPLISADMTYVSCIFDWNKPMLEPYLGLDNVHVGGSGYDFTTELPEYIESIKPKINLGFTTRGCIRCCQFCIVPKKEGKIRIIGDLLDLWDGKSKDVAVLDNNILALPEHFEFICSQARDNKIRVDFNQGLDHRLLTPEIISLMKSISHVEYRFAFDHPSYINTVEKAVQLLRKNKLRGHWYVLVGFNTTFDQDLFRLEYLRQHHQRAYLQRFKSFTEGKTEYTALAQWVNNKAYFGKMSFGEYINKAAPDNYRVHFMSFMPELVEDKTYNLLFEESI